MKPEGERYTVASDFDGVIHSYTTPWQSAEVIPDPPVEGAIAWLNEMVKHFEVVILTTRGKTPEACSAVQAWLREHGYLGPDLRVTSEKVPALIYLDDRAVRFMGPGTFPTQQFVHAARPWNKA